MATFVFKLQYAYVPTVERSQTAAARRKLAPKQVGILDKLQHVRSSSTSLSMVAAVVAAANSNGGYKSRI
jgi:hypothetical protein